MVVARGLPRDPRFLGGIALQVPEGQQYEDTILRSKAHVGIIFHIDWCEMKPFGKMH